MSKDIDDQLVVLYKQMYEMTNPECQSCLVPLSCCDSLYCECAEKYALEDWGVDLTPLKTDHPKLPFMGESGCVVAPHLRPLCTLHTCDISGAGFKRDDPEWAEKYFALRDQIEELEWAR